MRQPTIHQMREKKKSSRKSQGSRKVTISTFISTTSWPRNIWVTGDRRPASVRYGVMSNVLVDREPERGTLRLTLLKVEQDSVEIHEAVYTKK
jgi:hypothetical protein